MSSLIKALGVFNGEGALGTIFSHRELPSIQASLPIREEGEVGAAANLVLQLLVEFVGVFGFLADEGSGF